MTRKGKTLEEFNVQFWKHDTNIHWYHDAGIMEIDGQTNAVITLSERGTIDHWKGYNVEIINLRSGKITSQFFKFSDYLEHDPAGREYAGDLHLWTSDYRRDGIDWYIAKPKTIQPIKNAIIAYIRAWRVSE